MQLSHQENDNSNETYNQMKALETRIESLEINIDLEQKEINNLELSLVKLNNDFKITCVCIVISVLLLIRILSKCNAKNQMEEMS